MNRLLVLALIVILPLTAGANPFPLSEDGLDWNAIIRTDNPYTYLWAMAAERVQVIPIGVSSLPFVSTYQYVSWYSNQYVPITNISAGVTNVTWYTNKIPIMATGAITNDLVSGTNVVYTKKHTGTDRDGNPVTNTVVVSLTAQSIPSIAASVFGSSANAYVLPYEMYGGSDFGSWFAMLNNGGPVTNHPPYFPNIGYADGPRVFVNELGPRYGDLNATDQWGVVHYQGGFPGSHVRLSRDLRTRSAELAFTTRTNGGWDFHNADAIADIDDTFAIMYVTNDLPAVLTYTTTGSVPDELTVTVEGFTWNGLYGTRYDPEDLRNYVNETHTIYGASNTTLSLPWWSVTNIYVHGALASNQYLGDSISVQYTDGLKYFGGGAELDLNDLNELWKVMHPLTMVAGIGSWYLVPPDSNYMQAVASPPFEYGPGMTNIPHVIQWYWNDDTNGQYVLHGGSDPGLGVLVYTNSTLVYTNPPRMDPLVLYIFDFPHK